MHCSLMFVKEVSAQHFLVLAVGQLGSHSPALTSVFGFVPQKCSLYETWISRPIA